MNVKDILEKKGRDVYFVQVDTIVGDALQVMNKNNIGALMVMDDRRDIHGIVSERDVMRTCNRIQGNCREMAVRQIMTPREKLIVAHDEDDINDLMGTMTQNHIRHLPVVDQQKKVVGVISIGDIIKAMLKDQDYKIHYLKDYIENKYPL